MSPLFDVKDMVVVFAGRLGRLGLCLADCMVQEGAIVVLIGTWLEEGRAMVDSMVQQGGEASFFEVDSADPYYLSKVQEDIMLEYGRIDALIYEVDGWAVPTPDWTGGSLLDAPFREASVDEGSRNLDWLLLTVRTFLKSMLRQHQGCVVFLVDYPHSMPSDVEMSYRQVLMDISCLTRSLAGELLQKFGPGYRVNALMAGKDDPSLFHPEHLQGTLQYLLSEASVAMIGCVLLVDEGFHLFAEVPAVVPDA